MPFPPKKPDDKKPAPTEAKPAPDAPKSEAKPAVSGPAPAPGPKSAPAKGPSKPSAKGGNSAPEVQGQGEPEVKPEPQPGAKAEPEESPQGKSELPKEADTSPAKEKQKGLPSVAVMTKEEAEKASRENGQPDAAMIQLMTIVEGLAKLVQKQTATPAAVPGANTKQMMGAAKAGMLPKPGMTNPGPMRPGGGAPTAGVKPAMQGGTGMGGQQVPSKLTMEQITGLMGILEAANAGRIPRAGASLLLQNGFGLAPEVATAMVSGDPAAPSPAAGLAAPGSPAGVAPLSPEDIEAINPEEEELEEGEELEEELEEEEEEESDFAKSYGPFDDTKPSAFARHAGLVRKDSADEVADAVAVLEVDLLDVCRRLDALTYLREHPDLPFVMPHLLSECGVNATEKRDHAEHDQKDHGNREGGGGDRAVALASKAHENGGFTYRPTTGGFASEGYAVSIHPEHEQKWVGKSSLSPDKVRTYVADRKEFFEQNPKAHLGGWYNPDDDTWYLDVSHVTDNKLEAVSLGARYKQKGIYDLKEGRTITDSEYGEIAAGERGDAREAACRLHPGFLRSAYTVSGGDRGTDAAYPGRGPQTRRVAGRIVPRDDHAEHDQKDHGNREGGGGGGGGGEPKKVGHSTWRASKEAGSAKASDAMSQLREFKGAFPRARKALESAVETRGFAPRVYAKTKTAKVRTDTWMNDSGVGGSHYHEDGEIVLAGQTAEKLQAFADRWAKDPEWERGRHAGLPSDLKSKDPLVREGALKIAQENLGMHVMIHETLHGYGPLHSDDIEGPGLLVEEVTTEVATRVQLNDDFGYDLNACYEANKDVPVGYQPHIEAAAGAIAATYGIPRDAAEHVLEHAAIAFKQLPTPSKSHRATVNLKASLEGRIITARYNKRDDEAKELEAELAGVPDVPSADELFAQTIDAVFALGPKGEGHVELKSSERATKLKAKMRENWYRWL